MTTQSIMESLFGDDPFFQDDWLLWERRGALTERFLQRRAELLESFNIDGLMKDLLQGLNDISSSSSSSYSSSSSSKVVYPTKPDSSSTDSGTEGVMKSVELPDHKDPPALTSTQEDDDLLRNVQSLDDLFIPASSPSSSTSSPSSSACNIFFMDASGASPEDITVTLSGRKLEINVAKPTAPDVKSVELPDHVHPSTLTCTLGDDGFLRIQTEKDETSKEEQLIPIRFRASLDFTMNKDD
ncbi:heat shock protein beta-9 [Trichomycterus rosablanca]|uniref:heat shock protein beta-9 n=1 Tax=Trichomycterus rosablanca TaxID=2290929 RepID=UPI002F35DF5F